jgi:hypothetical protein
VTGLDLKLKRTARRVRVIDLARVMGVNHSRISQIEATGIVTQRSAARYLAALSTFPEPAAIVDPDGLTAAGHGRAA